MNELRAWFAGGGCTMIALGAVSAVLCFLIVERMLTSGALMRSIRHGRLTGNGDSPEQAAWAGLRRMGVALARGTTIETALQKAEQAATAVAIKP